MRVFLAGATGAIGRPLVPKLIEAGHTVTCLTRSGESAARLRERGAAAAVADVFDREAVSRAMGDASPEVVIHELTALPERFDPRDKSTYDATNKLRSEGTDVLLEGARAAGARRFVAQSIAFMYEPSGSWVKDEEAPVLEAGPPPFGEATRILREMERRVTGDRELEGVVLRYGWFYGPGTYFGSDGSTAAEVARRRFPIIGKGEGRFSFIHVEDAADATLASCTRGAPGIYNVVDDEPAPMREWLPLYAEALGARRPLRVPKLVARLAAGKMAADLGAVLRGASNEKAKRELGWEPRHPSWRQGFARSLAAQPA